MTSAKILAYWGEFDSEGVLRSMLVAAGFEVAEARTSEEALGQADTERPAAVLLELGEADASGYLICRLLRERYGELLPILFVSGDKVEASDRVVGLLLGADDYVTKPFDASEVVARIRRLVSRSAAPVVDNGVANSDEDDEVEHFDLTKREREVMALLLRGLTQSEIARELVISSNTVATHIQRILLKLGVHNRAQAVAKVARAGWLEMDALPLDSSPGVSEDGNTPAQAHEART